MEIEALFDTDLETIRSSKFMAGATADIDLVFTSTETAGASLPYRLTITAPLCYVTDNSVPIPDGGRLKTTLQLKATQNDSNQPLTIVLRDLQGTKYIT